MSALQANPLPPNQHAQLLSERIDNRTARLAVVGLGYVGLPLAVQIAEAGFRVCGLDVSKEKVARLLEGQSYIDDVPTEAVRPLVEDGRLTASTDFAALAEVDCICICVPTPLRKTREPDLSYVVAAVETTSKHLRAGQLLVLESTTYPGTTEEIIRPAVERCGLEVGKEVFVAFSPERVDPANPVYKTKNTPKVIGGSTAACTALATKLYETFIDTVVPVSSATAAEMVKLLENTYRAINIGLANEIALICHKFGLDVWEIIDAAATKPFGYQAFYPGPGLGGHCIPIDPLYLSWKLRAFNTGARFIELADEVNKSMPAHCVTRVTAMLNDVEKSVKGSRILLLGMAYKKNVSDVRESPALDIAKLLLERGAVVRFADPHVPSCRIEGQVLERVELTDAELASADLVAILTAHAAFSVDQIVTHASRIFDARNLTRGRKETHIVRL